MSNIDEIKERNERRNKLMNERKDKFDMPKELEYEVLTKKSVDDVKFLLAKLEQAEKALNKLDQAMVFKRVEQSLEIPKNVTTGTEILMWDKTNKRILALNNAKKFAAETLEKLKN